MTLTHIAIFGGLSLLAGAFLPNRARGFFLFTLSLLAVYWLQPALPIRYLDFWLPTATLGLVTLIWIGSAASEARFSRENLISATWMAALVLILGLTRYFLPDPLFTASLPPRIDSILLALVVIVSLLALSGRFLPLPVFQIGGIIILIALLVVLKSPDLLQPTAAGLRLLAGQSPRSASVFDIRWLGFSYIAFRLIHTLREHQTGRLPAVSLMEYATFTLFYPSLTAGPIDRLERFIKDLRQSTPLTAEDWTFSARRLALGLFKKFILADALAIMSLNVTNAAQIQSAGWGWIMLYAYSLQIYLDFSGYTDMALGLARLVGVRLPENFNQPYLRPNLTQFWNNWHMTLTQWFRAYFFNPFTRSLRTSRLKFPAWSIILIVQIATMALIGLWHGITWNFLLWGLWHGLGLFLQNRWSDFVRSRVTAWAESPLRQSALNVIGGLLTFQYVALGWVWFVLPTPDLALKFFRLLMGQG